MSNVVAIPKPSDLENFINFLYDGLEGYAYVATKEPIHSEECTDFNCTCWDQAFFEYPAQLPQMIKGITKCSPLLEVYIAPAIFKNQKAEKEDFKASNVVWLDLDGNAPDSYDIPPSVIVRSSEPGHAHVYWRLDSPITDAQDLESYNRRLCYKYGADLSGWNANKVLRPPYTVNHKRGGLPVAILWGCSDTSLSFNKTVFDELAPAPEKTVDYALWEKLDLPSLNDVIYSNKFGPDFKLLFEKQKDEVSDRSKTLANMAFVCAEAGLSDKEIYVIISNLATRWEKFKHHTPSSRARQLIAIIEHARIKYPHSNFSDFDQVFEYSPKTLLETDIQIEWAIKDMLMKNGVMLLAGQSGIGKTQVSMQFMAHLAVGRDFLHYSIPEPKKIGFFSLEMGDLELKHFMQTMYPRWVEIFTPEEIHLLNQNLKIIPFGESLPLNSTHGQDVMVQYLEANEWDGIFVDSVGSAILGNISASETVQSFTNFNDKIRKRYGCFLWYVHHFRKPAPGTKQYGGQEDLFGDQYLTARATSVYTLTKAKNGLLRVRNAKNRHAAEEEPYLIRRELGLTFSHQGMENETPDALEVVKEQLNNLGKDHPTNDQSPKPW